MGTNDTKVMATVNMGIVVTDLPASREFYMKVIGLEPGGIIPITQEQSESSNFAGGQAFKIHMYKANSAKMSGTGLKLIEFADTKKRKPLTGINEHQGINYLTFTYSESEYASVQERVKESNTPKVGHIDSTEFQAIYVRDPDGNFCELIYFP